MKEKTILFLQRVYLHYELVHQEQQTEEADTEETEPEEANVDNDEVKENNTRSDSEMVKLLDKVEDMYDTVWKMYLRFKVTNCSMVEFYIVSLCTICTNAYSILLTFLNKIKLGMMHKKTTICIFCKTYFGFVIHHQLLIQNKGLIIYFLVLDRRPPPRYLIFPKFSTQDILIPTPQLLNFGKNSTQDFM